MRGVDRKLMRQAGARPTGHWRINGGPGSIFQSSWEIQMKPLLDAKLTGSESQLREPTEIGANTSSSPPQLCDLPSVPFFQIICPVTNK